MISRISQLKQTLSEEFQQNSQQKQTNDTIATIERNAKLLKTEGPNVDNIIMELEDKKPEEAQASELSSSNEANEPSPKEASPSKEPINNASPPSSSSSASTVTTGETQEKQIDDREKNANEKASETPDIEEKTEMKESKEPEAAESPEAPKETNIPKDSTPHIDDPSIHAKLVKFAKYEEKYPQLLKAYKQEKRRNELVKLYEKVLSEHTPCSSIAEPQVLVDYLNDLTTKTKLQQEEIEKLGSKLKESQGQVDKLQSTLSSYKNDLSKVRSELESLKQQQNHKEQENMRIKQESNQEAELKSKLHLLETELAAAEQARDAASKAQSTSKSQVDELNTRLRETLSEIDILRDELQEADGLARDRLQELSTLRGQLLNKEKGRRRSADETVNQLSTIVSEKEQLEAEVELLNKRIIRESDQLNLQIKSLRTQLRESEMHEEELRRQLKQTQSVTNDIRSSMASNNSSVSNLSSFSRRLSGAAIDTELMYPQESSYQQNSQESASLELKEALEAASSASKANELLKQVNADNALRIDKLQKAQRALSADIEKLRHENLLLKKRGRSSSLNSKSSTPQTWVQEEEETAEKQQAYLKNVLLGFIEHKGQRRNLMPVLATLLGLKESEADRFMKEFA